MSTAAAKEVAHSLSGDVPAGESPVGSDRVVGRGSSASMGIGISPLGSPAPGFGEDQQGCLELWGSRRATSGGVGGTPCPSFPALMGKTVFFSLQREEGEQARRLLHAYEPGMGGGGGGSLQQAVLKPHGCSASLSRELACTSARAARGRQERSHGG